jgi:hypothetical protein
MRKRPLHRIDEFLETPEFRSRVARGLWVGQHRLNDRSTLLHKLIPELLKIFHVIRHDFHFQLFSVIVVLVTARLYRTIHPAVRWSARGSRIERSLRDGSLLSPERSALPTRSHETKDRRSKLYVAEWSKIGSPSHGKAQGRDALCLAGGLTTAINRLARLVRVARRALHSYLYQVLNATACSRIATFNFKRPRVCG